MYVSMYSIYMCIICNICIFIITYFVLLVCLALYLATYKNASIHPGTHLHIIDGTLNDLTLVVLVWFLGFNGAKPSVTSGKAPLLLPGKPLRETSHAIGEQFSFGHTFKFRDCHTEDRPWLRSSGNHFNVV